MEILKVDPGRSTIKTGIFVRVQSISGWWRTHDIAELDGPSLLAWLRSRGGNNPWAENTVATLLGHEEPIATE